VPSGVWQLQVSPHLGQEVPERVVQVLDVLGQRFCFDSRLRFDDDVSALRLVVEDPAAFPDGSVILYGRDPFRFVARVGILRFLYAGLCVAYAALVTGLARAVVANLDHLAIAVLVRAFHC
jgi:hypothetical protein